MNYSDILKSNQAKKEFIKGLIRLAKADGEISQEEQQYFLSAAVSIGLQEAQITEISESLSASTTIQLHFDTEMEKLLLFREGIQLCAVDESYDENEKTEVRLMATELGISEDAILRIEAWVQEGMEWKRRGDKLLHSN